MSQVTVSERPAEAPDEAPAERTRRNHAAFLDRAAGAEELVPLADGLNFKEKVERSLAILDAAWCEFGDRFVVANSLGAGVVWHLAKRVSPDIRGFIVVTRYTHPETLEFMGRVVARYPELKVYSNDEPLPDDVWRTDPDRCCERLKVEPARRAIEDLGAACWATGVRATSGRGRAASLEVELRTDGLVKVNPILVWHEREVWQYAALNGVEVNPLYAEGYRSLGCAPCTRVVAGRDERAGRWIGTSKCGGECGINTKPMKLTDGAGI